MPQERWKWVEGWKPMYQVSTRGRVRSFLKTTGRTYPVWQRILKTTPRPDDGMQFAVFESGGRRETRTVASLVLRAFVGPRPKGTWATHLNGNRSDMRLANLAWRSYHDTQLEIYNSRVMQDRGEDSFSAKLTGEQVRDIVKRRMQGATQREVAELYGVGPTAILGIENGYYWKHITKDMDLAKIEKLNKWVTGKARG